MKNWKALFTVAVALIVTCWNPTWGFVIPTANTMVGKENQGSLLTGPGGSHGKFSGTPSTIRTSVWLSEQPSSSTSSSSSSTSTTPPRGQLPFWLDIGTKGGAVVWSIILFVIPLIVYNVAVSVFQADETQTGIFIGVGFTVLATLGWSSTYLFRVATKDMTYAKQLKDYENAVIAKRLEELDEDELQALQEEIERDNF